MRYVLAFVLLLGVAGWIESPAHGAQRATCAEDAPCWTWSTMGNMQRGVFVHGRASRVIVDPCGFAVRSFRGRIDWTRTPVLRGDGIARAHGCDPRYFA